jgi:hypothetical protein
MSQGNWGGGPPGGGGPGGWGGGGPPGAPPGGGGYGPPPGGGGYGPPPGGAPPGGGGYGPPGGAPPGGGGYGPPGGGGYGPPGGAPPGGGGYGPPGAPPGGGGYGPPGGAPPGGGYGPPPGGGGYGPPPGGPGYGPPPGGDFGPPPGAMAPMGQRVQFNGEGGPLLVLYLLFTVAPAFAGGAALGAFRVIGNLIDGPHGRHAAGPVSIIFAGIGFLIYLTAILLGSLVTRNKTIQFLWDNTVIDGQRARYVGTTMGLFKSMILHVLLNMCTMGIYAPWLYAKYWSYVYENTEINGQRGRLSFNGDPGSFLGKYILGLVLTMCTAYIYFPWLYNDVCAFHWENTKIDGRGFGFRKDGGSLLGTFIVTAVLSLCTLYIYIPWGICKINRWEAERVT